MRYSITILLVICLCPYTLFGQELFPNTEPASTMAKRSFGVRAIYETYKEIPSQRTKHYEALRFMYGLTGKLTLMVTASSSNHHFRTFPKDLRNYFVNHHTVFYKPNPLLFEGFNFYAKYRVLSIDEKQKHLRIALYGEASKTFVPHDEAEPTLSGDNSGIGGGLIVTQLYKRLAASVTAGGTHPFMYRDPQQQLTFQSGDAWNYNISVGYRIYPAQYKNYHTTNVNLYIEMLNKHYYKSNMTVDGRPYDFSPYRYLNPFVYNSLQENKYSEIRPSIQFIFNSNDRLDIGVAGRLYNRSYLHYYPMFFFHYQKYFYSKKTNSTSKKHPKQSDL